MKNKVEQVAKAFSEALSHEIGTANIEQVIIRNSLPSYSNCCASHDFCDSNECMGFAMQAINGGFNLQSSKDIALANAAWDEAKENHFYA